MKSAVLRGLLAVPLLLAASGCAFLLPTAQTTALSRWHGYSEAKADFDRIAPGTTVTNELAALGFDPAANPNVRILTYLDVVQRFMPNQSITKEDLDPAVRAFIEHREQGEAWEIEVNDVQTKRHGNAFLDVTGFVRKSHETGWQFKGLLLIRDGRVVYKLASGQPKLDRHDKKVRPLGPLQELDGLLIRAAEESR
jgi:hypothetical protein